MDQENNKTFYALWLFNPFFSSIFLFRNYKSIKSIVPYLFLSFFFGFSFVVSTSGADSQRYAQELQRFYQQNISLSDVLNGFYSEEGSSLDIYQPVITWLVSLFTDNVHLLFAIFALIFGYFWFKSLLLIHSYIVVPLKGLVLLTFLLLVLTNPIWSINGVRMWTAIGVFFYGLLLLKLQKKRIGWYYLIASIFFHFSLVIAVVLFLTYYYLPIKNKTILFSIFIITFFLGELDLNIVRGYFEQLPGFLQSKRTYLSEDYVEGLKEAKQQIGFHVILAKLFLKYIILTITILMYYYSLNKKIIFNNHIHAFFLMGLYFSSFSHLASSVPSGGRFIILSNLIILTAFLFFLNQSLKWNIFIKYSLSVVFLFIIIFKIREGLDFIGFFFFFGNPIANCFVESNTPLIDFIKDIF